MEKAVLKIAGSVHGLYTSALDKFPKLRPYRFRKREAIAINDEPLTLA